MNPFFGVMGGGRPNMMQQFQQFKTLYHYERKSKEK